MNERADIPASAFPLSIIVAARVLTAFLIIASLKIGEALLIPIALSLLMAFLLSPAVDAMEKRRVPRYPAAIFAVGITLTFSVAFGWFVVSETSALWGDTPKFRSNISHKFSDLVGNFKSTVRTVEHAFILTPRVPPAPATARAVTTVLAPSSAAAHEEAVGIAPGVSPVVILSSVGLAVAELVIMLLVVAVLSVFLLVHREEARERLLGLFGSARLITTTQVMSDAAHGVRRYLLLNLFVNTVYAMLLGILLVALGIPTPFLWAAIAVFLRFVPHVGVYLSLIPPLICALALDTGWSTALLLLVSGVTIDAAMSNFVEPHVYGRRIGVSSIALVLSALFWTWCWGIFGLLLATPFSVLLAVLGRYVPGLESIAVMFGESSGLLPAQKFYHQLLAGNEAGAKKLLEEINKDSATEGFLDELVIPAMQFAEADRERKLLSEEAYRGITERARAAAVPEGAALADAAPAAERGKWRAAILPMRTESEAALADLIAKNLRADGANAEALSEKLLPTEVAAELEGISSGLLVVIALSRLSTSRLHYFLKRLSAGEIAVPILVFAPEEVKGAWKLTPVRPHDRAVTFVTTYAALSNAVRSLATSSGTDTAPPAELRLQTA